MDMKADVRPSPIAGKWYPADPRRLAESVDQFLDQARLTDLPGEVIGVVAPHAGHLYSGPVAGYAFAALRGMQPDVVVVVAPMHYPYFEPLLTTAHSKYQTPLGEIAVHNQALQALDDHLKELLGVGMARIFNDPEHALEIELPFLQRALAKPFSLIPVMVREPSLRVARALGRALAFLISESPELAGQQTILVASTDLSHFYPQPQAEALDAEMLRCINNFDPEGVIRTEQEGKGFACGCGALSAVLFAAKMLGADRAQVVHYATSGDVTGDYDRVVGYGAAVITKPLE